MSLLTRLVVDLTFKSELIYVLIFFSIILISNFKFWPFRHPDGLNYSLVSELYTSMNNTRSVRIYNPHIYRYCAPGEWVPRMSSILSLSNVWRNWYNFLFMFTTLSYLDPQELTLTLSETPQLLLDLSPIFNPFFICLFLRRTGLRDSSFLEPQ